MLAAGFDVLYAVTSDKRVLKITQNITLAGSFWKDEELTTTPSSMDQLALGGAELFMAGEGEIISMSLDGSGKNQLYGPQENSIDKLVVKGAYVYWLEAGKEIKRYSRFLGGTPEVLVTGADIKDFAVDSTKQQVYYSTLADNGEFYAIIKHDTLSKVDSVVTEMSRRKYFSLNDSDEVYVAVLKVPSSSAAYEAFVKFDASGVEASVRAGLPPVSGYGDIDTKLLSFGNNLYYIQPKSATYKIQ